MRKPISNKGVMVHKPDKGKGSYDRKKEKSDWGEELVDAEEVLGDDWEMPEDWYEDTDYTERY